MASLKRGNGRAIPLGLRDRPPNTHARVVRRVGPEPDGGCGQPSTGRERTPAGLSSPLVPEQFRLRRPASRATYPTLRGGHAHSPMVTLTEVYLEPNGLIQRSPIASQWLGVLRSAEIPYDVRRRKQILKHAYHELKAHVAAHQAIKDRTASSAGQRRRSS